MKIYLNLLPQQRKKEIRRKKIFRTILGNEMLFLLPIAVFIFMLLNIYYILIVQRDASIAAHSLQQAQEKYQQLSKYEEKFKQMNDAGQTLGKIQKGHIYWQKLFQQLSDIMPSGISINDLSTKNYKVFVLGRAGVRDDLLNFKSRLDGSECFQNVNVPLSNLVVKEDVDFQLDFEIKSDCLKKSI